ncbi:glycosyltransferase family 4 protein [Methylocystis parvus]|uniref:Glycosyltransferase family 4 protein n=1 Tax=Methylocystis parvus TaxID=134 RepID=A0A6B8M3B9_9HYPH|nr:glycosyltransferase family 1 protein [Methylocystis parvus]QGM98364.1 glycosyltransferase family 4 protein [Methylocystis parvus]WBK01308.1 glycosyltransferase family 4 protein [Methylocystis parvus OBBP]
MHTFSADEKKITLYLAAQAQRENAEMRRRRFEESVDPITTFAYLRLRELYWTVTRSLGLSFLHDGERRRRRLSIVRRPPLSDETALQVSASLPSRRIFIDVTPTARFGGKTGIQRVVREIAKRAILSPFALPVVIQNGAVVPYYDHPSAPRILEFTPDDTFVLLDACWGLTSDYLPVIGNLASAGGRLVTVIHDLIPLIHPLSVSPEMSEVFKEWFERLALASDAVICVSRSVAQDFIDYASREPAGVKPDIRVGWWRLGSDFADDDFGLVSPKVEAFTSRPTPFFLGVGTLEPRKAYPVALDAFELLWNAGVDARYVIIGRAGWQSEALTRRIRRHPEFGRRLLWLDKASDADLRHCYERAAALVYPSAIEGFGLPLVEAGRQGLPVIASDLPVFHELGGNHIDYFKLLDPVDLAQKIERRLWIPATEKRMPDYSWEDSAKSLVDLILHDGYQMRIGPPEPSLAARE